jgi:hypothetical protein
MLSMTETILMKDTSVGVSSMQLMIKSSIVGQPIITVFEHLPAAIAMHQGLHFLTLQLPSL